LFIAARKHERAMSEKEQMQKREKRKKMRACHAM